jgi:hypothetical protein
MWVRKTWDNQRLNQKTAPRLDKQPLAVEVNVGAEQSFYEVLSGAIDEAFSSLGESVREAIFFHSEKTFGIRRSEIPYRIDDFSDALERIFGLGARRLEILFMKNLHAKVGTVGKCGLPKWVVPELTFKEYVRMMKQSFE